MPYFHQYECFFFNTGEMFTEMRASNPATFRILTKLIRELATDHHDLLTAQVNMWLKVSTIHAISFVDFINSAM